jgi:hypothetical protein
MKSGRSCEAQTQLADWSDSLQGWHRGRKGKLLRNELQSLFTGFDRGQRLLAASKCQQGFTGAQFLTDRITAWPEYQCTEQEVSDLIVRYNELGNVEVGLLNSWTVTPERLEEIYSETPGTSATAKQDW